MYYGLNGKDLATLFGTFIMNGSDTFLAFPERKDSLSHDWPEETGIDIDLTEPTFKAREFVLKCVLKATSRDDFFNKYDGLFTELKGQGTHELYVSDLDKTHILYYKKQQNITKLSRINSTHVGVTFELVFGETNPDDNITPVYLVDDQDNFLIA